jgi:hypothetical protein
MSAAWVRVSSSRSASVGGQFHADEVFKHFVGPVQPYDDQSVQMSREAYLQDLKRWGLIETPDDQTMQAIKAAANPRIRVHGKFGPRGAFVIHVVESEPPPTSEPWFMPKVGIAFLRCEMYSLRLPLPYYDIPLQYLTEHTGYMPGKIEFAGKVSDAWDEVALYRPHVWRVEFGLRRGRPLNSGGRFKNAEDFRRTVVTDLRNLLRNGRNDTQEELARLWYQNSDLPTAELDSLVAEIKRYCHTYKMRWKSLQAEARRK